MRLSSASCLAALLVAALLAIGCAGGEAAVDDDCGDGPDDPACSVSVDELRIPGSFSPDPAALAAGSSIIAYDDVPAWDGGAHCTGGFTAGGRSLSSYLRANFSGISSVGGYSCRPNTASPSRMSVHGSGRALDIMIPTDHGDADNGVGDRIANWLIRNSRSIGVQYLIWDRTQWSAHRSSGRVRAYTGPNPHIDHIHAEITLEASRLETPFFTGGSVAPPMPTCTPSGESCNGRDDDCDGRVDEGVTRACGSDVGECRVGRSTCSSGSWGACSGAVGPTSETCDARDQDCDGRTDESLVRSCGTDVGECVSGTETCGRGDWGSCMGAVDPVPEICDTLDNDCDGADDDERICEREEVAFSASVVAALSESDASGDGRADACARIGQRMSCLAATDHGFDREIMGPVLGDAGGWSERLRSSSLRMVDIDGDGRSDLCGRDGDRLACWRSEGQSFGERIAGPAYAVTATSGELADIDGDGLLDACVRDASGLVCAHGTGRSFSETVVRLDALSDAHGYADVIHHGTLRFGDVDGDGRSDVCARSADGVDCWPSEGDRFGTRILGPRWSDATGWDVLPTWSTIRLADADGDGRADVCARTPQGFRCALSLGGAFGEELVGPDMDVADGWDRADVYSTIRMDDVDGDGRDDLCARAPSGVSCWLAGAHAFDQLVQGPALDDASGFTEPAHFRSIRLADVDGDGRADLCARESDALRCYLSEGHAFGRVWIAPTWSDALDLGDDARLASIRIAGGGGPGASAASTLPGTAGCSASPGRAQHGAWMLIASTGLLFARRRRR